jgi:TolB protein
MIPSAGGERVQISPEGANSFDHGWSPDGGTIAFLSDAAGGTGKLMTVPASGGTATLVTDMDVYEFDLSPDGRSVLLVSAVTPGGQTAALYRLPASGGTPTILTADVEAAFNGRWSPDGTMIAFSGTVDGVNFEIFVMDADGSNRRILAAHPAHGEWVAAWSRDGAEVFFRTNRNGNSDIAAVSVADGTVRMLAASEMNEEFNDLSKDGSTLVYTAIPTDNSLVTVKVDKLLRGGGPE